MKTLTKTVLTISIIIIQVVNANCQVDTFAQKLVGTWNWESACCGWMGEPWTPIDAGYSKKIIFYQTSQDIIDTTLSYTLYKDSAIIKTGITTLSIPFPGSVTVQIDSNVIDELDGGIYGSGFRTYFDGDSLMQLFDGWYDGATYYYRKDLTTSNYIISQQLPARIYVFPNPSNKYVTISIENSNSQEYTISFYDLTGKLAGSFKFIDNMRIDLSDLNNGIYSYYIEHQNKIINAGKVVYQK